MNIILQDYMMIYNLQDFMEKDLIFKKICKEHYYKYILIYYSH